MAYPRTRRCQSIAGIALALVCIAGCNAIGTVADKIQQPSKANLTNLSPGMILPQSDFPQVDGEFHDDGTETWGPKDRSDYSAYPEKNQCVEFLGSRLPSVGDQSAKAKLETPDAFYFVGLFLAVSRSDLQSDLRSWVSDCIPNAEWRWTSLDLKDLPAGSMSFENGYDGYLVTGFSRGVLVLARISPRNPDMPPSAKMDLVSMFTRQIKRLEAS